MLVEAHGGAAAKELIERVSEQRLRLLRKNGAQFASSRSNSHQNVKDVDLRLRAPRLRGHGDTNLMPVLGGPDALGRIPNMYEKLIDTQVNTDMGLRK